MSAPDQGPSGCHDLCVADWGMPSYYMPHVPALPQDWAFTHVYFPAPTNIAFVYASTLIGRQVLKVSLNWC